MKEETEWRVRKHCSYVEIPRIPVKFMYTVTTRLQFANVPCKENPFRNERNHLSVSSVI